ncbi:retrovirus-related pol polyprotein from transposon TNT 1-94 [Tanacetum coccineum]
MADHSWIESMQDELNQFERLQVWELVPRPEGKNVIALKWLWKNKCDADNIVVQNKTRLVAKVIRTIHQSPRGIFISQSQYAIELLKKHGLDECVSMSIHMATERLDADLQGTPTDQTTYCRMIGELMYLTSSRPDIAFATFVYADHAGCKDDCKSTSGGLQFLGGKLLCSSDMSAIAISCNPVQHSKTKHIDIRYHFIKEHVEEGYYEICFVSNRIPLAIYLLMRFKKERFEYYSSSALLSSGTTTTEEADFNLEELCPPKQSGSDLVEQTRSIAASASVPWIYMAQFWHTLKEDGSKHRLKFLLDRKELTLTLDDFRTIFHLPQANDNNHASFVPPPSFSDMDPFYKQVMRFTMELKTVSNFKISGLLQPWQTLMWEGIYYSLHHPVTSIPYPRFTKIIISHYMTIFPDISRRARDAYHNLQDDDIMKNIFNSGRNKNKVGMRIPAWMITDEMKLTEHYKMYAEVFGLDVPLTQSQPTESTQGTHRTPSAPRSPNPATETAESNMIQVSLAEHKSREEQEARENVALVYEHLAAEEIEKLVEDPENVDDSSPPRHDDTSIPGTRLEPRSDKESPEVEIV